MTALAALVQRGPGRGPYPAAAAAANKRRRGTTRVAAADDANADAAAAAAADDAPAAEFAVLGAGLAGLAAAYHLADLAPPGSRVVVYDAGGIGAGGSGAAAGLLHPVSPRGRRLWGAARAMRSAAQTLAAAERAAAAGGEEVLAWRTGMLRPAADLRQARDYGMAGAERTPTAEDDGGGCWLGGAPPRALLTADEARALLPGVAARDWAAELEEEEVLDKHEDDDQDASSSLNALPPSPEDAARRERQRRRNAKRQGRARGDASANQQQPRLASALHVPSGVTLHPRLYMRALWRACQDLCAAKGGSAELRLEAVPSVGALLSARRWRGVVVAAGAAVGALPEARDAGLPGLLELSLGYSLDVVEEEDPYLASRGGRELVVGGGGGAAAGSSKPTPEEALRMCLARRDDDDGGDVDGGSGGSGGRGDAEAGTAAERELLEGAARAWPPFCEASEARRARWRVARVRSGVRATPPRSPEGALPLVGRLIVGAGGAEKEAAEVWVVAGLGARGLVYHAWLGELAARGVVERTEAHVPPELLRWRDRLG